MTLTKLVTDGNEIWTESRQFDGLSKHQAQKLFKQYLKANQLKEAK